jgi:uncharacterized protein (DUF983 family)
MKRCFKCGIEKEIDEFYKHSEMADGHLGKCKECTKKDVFNNYNKNIEHFKKYDMERFKTNKRKKDILECSRRRSKKYPEKKYANGVVSYALKSGKIKKQPCEVCGIEPSEAHHDDYSKPLDVKWLCFKHHRLLHGQRNL